MAADDKVDILGVKVSKSNLQETAEIMSRAIETRTPLRVAVTPVNCILWARKDDDLRHIYNTAGLVTADGVPLVWASRLLGSPVRGRVTGLDLLPYFAHIAAQKGYRFFFLGAAEGVAEQLAEKLQKEHPGLQVAGCYSPPFTEKFSDRENKKMTEMINYSGADVLWVSLTAPKQDFWIAGQMENLQTPVAIGVGAAFDVVAGNIPRAPVWMQRSGLEWLYRLVKEPSRLSKRYLVEAPVFIPLILKQIFTNKRTKNDSEDG